MVITLGPSKFSSFRKAVANQSGVKYVNMKKTKREMERELGIANVKPIELSADDDRDAIDKGDYFAEWYEEELRELYE